MNAEYFYNKLNSNAGCYDYERNPYKDTSVAIHHKGDDDAYYTVHMDKSVLKHCNGEYDMMDILDLKGDDFELYNNIRLIKAGYLMVTDAHEALIDICDYFNERKGCGRLNITKDYYGNFRKGDAEIWIDRVRLNLLTVPSLIRENNLRKKFDKITFPFISRVQNADGIYIYTVDDIAPGFQTRRKEAEIATRELIDDIVKKQLGLKCKYKGCKIQRPIYY